MLRSFTIETTEADEKALDYVHVNDMLDFAFRSALLTVVNSARATMLRDEADKAHDEGRPLPPSENLVILQSTLSNADARNAEALAKFAAEQAERDEVAKRGPLTARQLRLGLVNNGFSLAQVEAAIGALPEGADKEKAQIEWQYAGEFNRDHPLLVAIAAQLGISTEQFDVMWAEARKL